MWLDIGRSISGLGYRKSWFLFMDIVSWLYIQKYKIWDAVEIHRITLYHNENGYIHVFAPEPLDRIFRYGQHYT